MIAFRCCCCLYVWDVKRVRQRVEGHSAVLCGCVSECRATVERCRTAALCAAAKTVQRCALYRAPRARGASAKQLNTQCCPPHGQPAPSRPLAFGKLGMWAEERAAYAAAAARRKQKGLAVLWKVLFFQLPARKSKGPPVPCRARRRACYWDTNKHDARV